MTKKPIELPKSVNVGYRKYKIREFTTSERDLLGAAGASRIDSDILVDVTGYTTEFVANTVLHEILHLCFYHAGLRDKYDHKEEENIVNTLTNQLSVSMKYSPEVYRWIINGFKE